MRFFILKKFKFNKNRFLSIISAVAASSALAAADVPPELQNATRIPDFTIPKSGDERQFQLPALPGKPGMVTVLRCRLSRRMQQLRPGGGQRYGIGDAYFRRQKTAALPGSYLFPQ